jgi:hypothetical protein
MHRSQVWVVAGGGSYTELQIMFGKWSRLEWQQGGCILEQAISDTAVSPPRPMLIIACS